MDDTQGTQTGSDNDAEAVTGAAAGITQITGDPETALEGIIAVSSKLDRATVRMRCELRLYEPQPESKFKGRYRFWPDSGWTLELPASVEGGMRVREAFRELIRALAILGAQEVIRRLRQTSES